MRDFQLYFLELNLYKVLEICLISVKYRDFYCLILEI